MSHLQGEQKLNCKGLCNFIVTKRRAAKADTPLDACCKQPAIQSAILLAFKWENGKKMDKECRGCAAFRPSVVQPVWLRKQSQVKQATMLLVAVTVTNQAALPNAATTSCWSDPYQALQSARCQGMRALESERLFQVAVQ